MLTTKPDVLCAAEKAMMARIVVCLLFIIVCIVYAASSNCRVVFLRVL